MTATSVQTTTINEPKQTTLYYREGSSDKIYQVSLEAKGSPDHFLVRFAYGRRGSTLQTGTKTPVPVDYDTALKTFNQLIASKVAKGYSPGQDGTPYQHTGHEGRSTGIYPQLLTAVEDEHALGHLMLDPLYCVQEKHDGKRLMVRKQGHTVEGINRRGLIVSVPESIVREMRQLAGDCLLDGEAVGGILYVFDVLESTWQDVRQQPYVDRLNLLNRLIPDDFTAIQRVYTAWSAREKIGLLERLRREQKEGIVLKLLTASYSPGKTSGSQDQLKYKLVESAQLRGHAGACHQAQRVARPVCLGRNSGGRQRHHPAHQQPIPATGAVVEVRYLYAFRQSGAVFQPVYHGEREDIEPADCSTSQLKYRHEAPVTIRV